MKLYNPADSRKLTGLYVTIGALLFTMILGAVTIAIWGVPTELFASLGGFILGAGTSHQAAQSMADRSSSYQNPTPPYVPPPDVRVP